MALDIVRQLERVRIQAIGKNHADVMEQLLDSYQHGTLRGSWLLKPFVRVRVKDNGQGMPVDVVQRVFDPLFTTKGEKGTGLGLPHVCAFMRLVGGHVEVTSRPTVGCLICCSRLSCPLSHHRA